MRTPFIYIFLVLFAVIACNKDTYESKPSLTIKSVSSTDVPPGSALSITLEYTDKEGDIADGQVGVEKVVRNCPSSDFIDTLRYYISGDVPATKDQKGEISISFTYTDINPICAFDDSATFRFWIKDQAGNVSDTATTSTIVIRKS